MSNCTVYRYFLYPRCSEIEKRLQDKFGCSDLIGDIAQEAFFLLACGFAIAFGLRTSFRDFAEGKDEGLSSCFRLLTASSYLISCGISALNRFRQKELIVVIVLHQLNRESNRMKPYFSYLPLIPHFLSQGSFPNSSYPGYFGDYSNTLRNISHDSRIQSVIRERECFERIDGFLKITIIVTSSLFAMIASSKEYNQWAHVGSFVLLISSCLSYSMLKVCNDFRRRELNQLVFQFFEG